LERLVSTAEAAKILNLSLQGVHYRIKNNQLNFTKKNGKTYVYIKEEDINETAVSNTQDSLISVKDEQIKLLRKVVKWHKKQYKQEIIRLQFAHTELKEALQSEIKLLQDAFWEMKKIYQHQISFNQQKTDDNEELISLKDFILLFKKYSEKDIDVKKIIIQRLKQKDNRFVYDKNKKEIFINKSYFLDLL